MSDSSTLGIGLWFWLPFLSSQGIGYGHGPPLDGAWFCGMGGEQDSGRNCACSSRPGSAAATSEETPTFSKRRRFSVNTVGLELSTDSIVPPILIEFLIHCAKGERYNVVLRSNLPRLEHRNGLCPSRGCEDYLRNGEE